MTTAAVARATTRKPPRYKNGPEPPTAWKQHATTAAPARPTIPTAPDRWAMFERSRARLLHLVAARIRQCGVARCVTRPAAVRPADRGTTTASTAPTMIDSARVSVP